MTTNTTSNRSAGQQYRQQRLNPQWGRLTLVAILLHVVGLAALWQLGFFQTSLEINREEARQVAQQTEQRARERHEHELKKEEMRLREEDRDKLEEYEREQLQDYVESLQRIDQEMTELKMPTFDSLEQRQSDQYREYLARQVLRLSRQLQSELTDYRNEKFRLLCE